MYSLNLLNSQWNGKNPDAICADLASMLLSNLTATSATCFALLSLEIEVISDAPAPGHYYPPQSRSGSCPEPVPYPRGEPRNVPALPLLVDAFVEGAKLDSTESASARRKGELHFLASVFANLTTVRSLSPYNSTCCRW